MDELTLAQIEHDIYLNRLSAYEAGLVTGLFVLLREDINAVFAQYDDVSTKKTANEISEKIIELIEPKLEEFTQERQESITELVEYETEFQQQLILNAGIGGAIGASLGQLVGTALKKINNTLIFIGKKQTGLDIQSELSNTPSVFKQYIKNAIQPGQGTIEEIRQSLIGTSKLKYKDGRLSKLQRDLETKIRTARKQAEIESQKQVYKKTNQDGYVLVAVIDSRTSEICLGLDGTVVYWSDAYQPLPPFHPNCRTTIAPYKEGVTKIDPDRGFKLFAKMPFRMQKEIIGKSKAQIFNKEGMTIEEFKKLTRNRLNKPLTLEQVKEKDSNIAEYLTNLTKNT